MSDLIKTGDPLDIEKEADRTTAIIKKVIDVLPKILNGDLKPLQCPEFFDLTLTYAFYGTLADSLKKHQHQQSYVLPIVLKFLFPDLLQFLPSSIFTLTTHVQRFMKKAKRLGELRSLYQPISRLYEAKCNSEWTDFIKCGITQDMLVTGPLVMSSDCQMQLKNRHVLLLLDLRNKYHLCWVKVVPQWLRFFGILQKDDCVRLQDIKSHWLELDVQVNNLKGSQLQEFLDAAYILPKSFIKKNIEPVTSSDNFNLSDVNKSTHVSTQTKENYCHEKSLQKELNMLRSHLTTKDKEISAYQKKLKQMQGRLEHLSTRLCKTRLVKNQWFMRYRTMSGINLFAEEFSADLAYAQKIRQSACYIKRILQLCYSDKSSQFVEDVLGDSFIEELLEKILVQDISFDKGSNILLEILQELVKHWQEANSNSDLGGLLVNNQRVPYGNRTAKTIEVLDISDSDSSPIENKIEKNQPINDRDSPILLYEKTRNKSCDLYEKTSPDSHSGAKNVDSHSQLQQNPSGFPQFLSPKNSISLPQGQLWDNAYVLYDTTTHKRTYNADEERSRDSGHASHEDLNSYQPNTKVPRLESLKPSPTIDLDPDSSYDPKLLPPVLEAETGSSPPFKIKESFIEDFSKPFNHSDSSPSGNKDNQDSKVSKSEDDLWILGDKYVSSLQSYPNLEPSFGDSADDDTIILVNRTISPPLAPPCLILENPDCELPISDKQACQKTPLDSAEINPDSAEMIKD